MDDLAAPDRTSVPPLPPECQGAAPVTVFLRPGCPFCAVLLLGLARTGLAFHRVDIWQQPEAAAWVRSVANGNETVPTVHVTATGMASSVALVNPSIHELVAVVARLAPEALRAHERSADEPRRGLERLRRLLGRRRDPQR
jgi:glutaredoxin